MRSSFPIRQQLYDRIIGFSGLFSLNGQILHQLVGLWASGGQLNFNETPSLALQYYKRIPDGQKLGSYFGGFQFWFYFYYKQAQCLASAFLIDLQAEDDQSPLFLLLLYMCYSFGCRKFLVICIYEFFQLLLYYFFNGFLLDDIYDELELYLLFFFYFYFLLYFLLLCQLWYLPSWLSYSYYLSILDLLCLSSYWYLYFSLLRDLYFLCFLFLLYCQEYDLDFDLLFQLELSIDFYLSLLSFLLFIYIYVCIQYSQFYYLISLINPKLYTHSQHGELISGEQFKMVVLQKNIKTGKLNNIKPLYAPSYKVMGIDGLLKFLRPITQKQHISSFKNQRAGIDIMSWIYRGCYSCVNPMKQSFNSNRYIYFILEMIEILGYYNIKPLFVFDGRSFQLKGDTNQKRTKEKQQNREKAELCMKQGKYQQARKYFSRCISIDEQKISTVMNVMYTKNIQFIVAPYEADCQIAKLRRLNVIDFAISQDSDLIAYGVNTIFKINQNGQCDYIDPNKWAPRDIDQVALKQYLAMSYTSRVQAAILASTDYNPSIKGIGIYRAVRLLYKQAKMINVIDKLKLQKVYCDKIPQNYQQLTLKVKLIFLFATVFNPITKTLEQLNPQLLQTQKPQGMTDQQFYKIVGEHYSQYIQMQVYSGKVSPRKLTPRQITSVNIKQMFKINKQNMVLHESHCMKRKQQIEKLKQDKQKQIKQEKEKKSQSASLLTQQKIIQLTKEQKQKKKNQRKNRIVKLQDVMNSVVKMFDQEEQEDAGTDNKIQQHSFGNLQKQLLEVSSILLKSQSQIQKQKQAQRLKQIRSQSQNERDSDQAIKQEKKGQLKDYKQVNAKQLPGYDQNQQDQQSDKEIQSESLDLAFLNPFAKSTQNNINNTAVKSKGIEASSSKTSNSLTGSNRKSFN